MAFLGVLDNELALTDLVFNWNGFLKFDWLGQVLWSLLLFYRFFWLTFFFFVEVNRIEFVRLGRSIVIRPFSIVKVQRFSLGNVSSLFFLTFWRRFDLLHWVTLKVYLDIGFFGWVQSLIDDIEGRLTWLISFFVVSHKRLVRCVLLLRLRQGLTLLQIDIDNWVFVQDWGNSSYWLTWLGVMAGELLERGKRRQL